MTLKFYNTLTRRKDVFRPLHRGGVRMYVCGPTVYGPIHIGNARTFSASDVLYRYLKYKGFRVKYVQNITDVGHLTDTGEDKIMVGARKMKMDVFGFVDLMMKNYFEDMESLNILKPDISPRASKHIQDMIKAIKKLIENGYAYERNGVVYYDISRFKDYGKLSGQKPEQLKLLRRKGGETKTKGDFALWIPCPGNYPMKWKSPWGTGFPGWHIECSVMSSKYLGVPFDIHVGGKDLIFPHHENEIAQTFGAAGKRLASFWLHSQFILINGKKMAKSLGNIINARDAVKRRGWRAVRYLLISSHYRTEINFTRAAIKQADSTVKKLEEFVANARGGKDGKGMDKLVRKAGQDFEKSMDDDLNMPEALSVIFEFVRKANKLGAGKKALELMLEFDRILGLKLGEAVVWKTPGQAEPGIRKLILKREKLRKDKKFREADKIRAGLRKKGVVLEDTEKGPRWKRVD